MSELKHNIFFYIILFFILFICLKIYNESDVFNLKCIVSGVDGNKYCVREREKINDAADLLATVTGKCKEMVNYMKDKYPNDPRVKKLVEGFNPKKINETLIFKNKIYIFFFKKIYFNSHPPFI